MSILSLAFVHARMVLRQRTLVLSVIPLTCLALLIAITSPGRPGTGGIADLVFSAQVIAVFGGIAYAAAFPDFATAPVSLGVDELEAATAASPFVRRGARLFGTAAVLLAPAAVILTLLAVLQLPAHPWSLLGAWAATATIVAPAALVAMALSATFGALLPQAVGRLVGVLVWFALAFSSPLLPLPTPNGTVFGVVGDAVTAGYFHAEPLYSGKGPLAVGSASVATLSLVIQALVVWLLLAAATRRGARSQTR